MVSEEKAKAASLVLTLTVIVLALCPVDISGIGIRQGCPLWQRLSYTFLHAGIMHAIANCWCLLSLTFGQRVRLWQLAVSYAIAVTYPVDTICSLQASCLSTVGMSGLCFALIGIITPSARRAAFFLSLAMLLAAGFLFPGVNATLHLYCCLAGLIVGLLTTPVSWKR